MYVRENVCVYMREYFCMCMCVCLCVYLCVCAHVCLYTHAYMYILFVRTSSDHISSGVDFRAVLYALSHTFNIISVEIKGRRFTLLWFNEVYAELIVRIWIVRLSWR